MLKTCCLWLLYALSIHATSAQNTYSQADSLAAKNYFSQSWNFPLHSVKHQLYLDSALQKIPTHAYYWQQKSMPLYKEQKYELARPYLDSAVKYDAGRWLDYRAFMICMYEKKYREAIREFKQAKQSIGNRYVMDHPYDFYLGLCYLQTNRWDSSEFYFDNCIGEDRKRSGKNPVHYLHAFYKGIVCYEQERFTEALDYFDEALKTYPRFSDAEYYETLILTREDKWPEALLMARKASQDYEAGYTLTEDNAMYEYYPYQVKAYYLKALADYLEKKNAQPPAQR